MSRWLGTHYLRWCTYIRVVWFCSSAVRNGVAMLMVGARVCRTHARNRATFVVRGWQNNITERAEIVTTWRSASWLTRIYMCLLDRNWCYCVGKLTINKFVEEVASSNCVLTQKTLVWVHILCAHYLRKTRIGGRRTQKKNQWMRKGTRRKVRKPTFARDPTIKGELYSTITQLFGRGVLVCGSGATHT